MKTFMRVALSSVLATMATLAFGEAPLTPIEPEAVALGRPVEFARDVRPILEANCTACHSRSSDESDLSLESIEDMQTGGGRGPAIVAGNADESLIYAVAAHRREPAMPPADNDVKAQPLTPRELGILRQWILEGASKGETASSMIRWRSLPPGYKPIHAVDLSPTDRFVAVARGNQVEIHDLVIDGPPTRLIDPALAALQHDGIPAYPEGAADRDIIQAVAFDPEGNTLATGGYRSIRLWRRSVFTELTPRLDVTGAQATAVAADGSQIAVAYGSELKLFSHAGAVVATWPVPAAITAVVFSHDGQRIAAIGGDHVIRVWSREGQELLARTSSAPATAIAFAGERIVTARETGILDVWNQSSEQPERELKGHRGRVVELLSFAGQANAVLSACDDGSIHVWDVTTDAPSRSLSHDTGLTAVAVTGDGQRLTSCGSDGVVRLWNLADGSKTAEYAGLLTPKRDEQRASQQLEWRKQLAAVADADAKEAETAVKDREGILKTAEEAKVAAETAVVAADKAASDAVTAAKAAADALAASPNDEALTKQAEATRKAADDAQAKAAASRDSVSSAERARTLAETALNGQRERLAARQTAKVAADEAVKSAEADWNLKKEAAAQSPAAKAIAYTLDGSRVIVGYAGGIVQSFSSTGQPLDAFTIGETEAAEIAAEAEGRILLRGADGTVRRFDAVGHWKQATTLGPPADAPVDLTRSEIADRVLALAFSPDGTLLASGGGEPSRLGELLLWNVSEQKLARRIAEPHSDTVQAIAFSRGGQTLATAGADKFVKTFNVQSGELQHAFEGHTDQVLGVSIKADGTLLASASADLGVKIWDHESGAQRRTIAGHGKQVTAVHFVGLTEDVVTAAGDKTVRLERSSSGQQIRSFAGSSDYVHAVAASHDGSTIVAGGEDGVLYLWDGKSGSLKRRIEPPQAATAEVTQTE